MKRSCGYLSCIAVWLVLGAHALANIPGDADDDGRISLDDFALLSLCQFGPNIPTIAACQEFFDFDYDSDLDLRDFAAFELCFSGDKLPANPACAGHVVRIEDGCLHVIGTSADSLLALRLKAGLPWIIEIDVGNDGLPEFNFDRGEFDCILISARGGNDTVVIDEVNGVFTDTETTTIDGGDGNDTLFGGSGAETFIGGSGADSIFAGGGDDQLIWHPGDGSDLVEGGAGADTVEVSGSNSAEQFTITANGLRVRFDRLSPVPSFLDIGTCEHLVLNANGGNDTLACTGNLASLIQITADGGPGEDTLLGSNGADVLLGGDGNDFIDGNQGNDMIFLGAGEDTFQWDPGDGSDTVEGQTGHDLIVFNGSAISEIFDFSVNNSRLRFTRNIAAIVLDADGVEQVDLRALGGADLITVNDLAGTDVGEVNVDLAASGGAGDGQLDNVVVNGTGDADEVIVAGDASGTHVTGLSAVVSVTNAEPVNDRLTVNTLGGDDHAQATDLASGVIGLTLSGGTGGDVLIGSAGADMLNGDEDNDTITGGGGDDAVQLGIGDDHFIWNPGDGSDLVEGGEGIDTVEINGTDEAEQFTITANGLRVRFDRLSPLPSFLDIGTCEHLVLDANGGNDTLACTGNLAALIQITADGGPGDDTLLGGNGADVLQGGDNNDFIDGNQGNDMIFLGAGEDTFQWDPGDGSDMVEGQAGNDIIIFNGSAASEILDFSASGPRLRFTRNIGAILLDADGIERFDLRALAGTDGITVNDLTGTALGEVNLDLGTLAGVGDGQLDAVTINGTALPDTIHIAPNLGAVEVSGLSALVRILHADAVNDMLIVNGLGGVDLISTDPGVAALITVTTNQD